MKCKNKICVVYGEGAMTDQACQKWFAKFCARDFSLDNAPQLDRIVEVDSDQIKTLIGNNEYYTTWEIADILKISKSIKLLVKMKNVSFILWKKLNKFLANPVHGNSISSYRLRAQSHMTLSPNHPAPNTHTHTHTHTHFRGQLQAQVITFASDQPTIDQRF